MLFHIQLIALLSFSILLKTTSEEQKLQDLSMKCGECPCVNPCIHQLPSPPPPPPPPPPATTTQYCPPQAPPPPRFIYFTSPTDRNSSPPPSFTYVTGLPNPTQIPPPPRFYYVTAPPGNSYLTHPYNWEIYSIATLNFPDFLLLLVGCGLLVIFVS